MAHRVPGPGLLVLASVVAACSAGSVQSARPVAPVPAPAVDQSSPTVPAAKPLTARERALLPELRRDVDELATRIGPRDVDHPWELADAADYLATELEAAGYVVERQGFEVRDGKAVVQNLSVTVSGSRKDDKPVIVAAHYDTPPDSRGADDNASGTALVLALARSFRGARPVGAVRFVFLANEHEPFAGTPDMGSSRFARRLVSDGDKAKATIAIRAVGGSLSRGDPGPSTPARQRSPEGVFVAGPPWTDPLCARVAQLLARDLNVTVAPATATAHPPTQDLGVWGFWQAGFSAVLLTRDPNGASSRAAAGAVDPPLDYDTMARLAVSIRSVIFELAAAAPEAESTEDLARVAP